MVMGMVAQSLITVPLQPLKQEILRTWTHKAAIVGLEMKEWIEDIFSNGVENTIYLLITSRYQPLCKVMEKY